VKDNSNAALLDLDVELGELDPVDLLRLASQQRNRLIEMTQNQERLEERILVLEHLHFGRKADRLMRRVDDPGQATLFDKEVTPEGEESLDEAEEDPPQEDASASDTDHDTPGDTSATQADDDQAKTGNEDKTKNGGGRTAVSRELPTYTKDILVNDALRYDENGEEYDTLGWDETEIIHYERGRAVRIVIRREKVGTRDIQDVAERAEVPERIVSGGKLSDPLIIELGIQKFYKGIPLARTLIEMNAQGSEISSSLVSDAMLHLGSFVAPIAECIKESVFEQPFLHADETPIDYQTGCGRLAKRKKGYFIILVAGNACFVDFASTRAGYQIAQTLALQDEDCDNRDPPDPTASNDDDEKTTRPYIGYLIVDAYAGYNFAVGDGRAIRVACNVHALRYFKRAAMTNAIAAQIVDLYHDIFRIEREARKFIKKRKLNEAQAHAHILAERTLKSQELWAKLRAKIEDAACACDPAGQLGRACAYFLKRYDELTIYLTDGMLPMDNNAAERSIRPITVGRKNYQFVGSEAAGANAAILYTLMESCRLISLDPWSYLTWVTIQIHLAHSSNEQPEYASLTPHAAKRQVRAWAKQRSQNPDIPWAPPFLA
jgi:transposase